MSENTTTGNKLSQRICAELLQDIKPKEVRRLRLKRGLGLAYREVAYGLLTISRKAPQWPSEEEIATVRRAFLDAALQLHRPVLLIKEFERKTVQLEQQHHTVVLAVYFGVQKRLI